MASDGFFQKIVTSEAALREVLGYPSERAIGKQRASLDAHCRGFIARSPFIVLGTSNAAGDCDVSPKGDPPGFVHVLDDKHLLIPDRPGNRRLDGLRNILENPHVAMIFFVPGRGETLRVNGRAWIVEDEDLLGPLAVDGKRPRFGIGVEVEEVFLHCPKALMRSCLWDPSRQADEDTLPSMARMLWDQLPVKPNGFGSAEEYERDSQERLRKELY
jgi:PPOX class probable FMN-dependent enzyme